MDEFIEIDGHNENQIFKVIKKSSKAKKPTVVLVKRKLDMDLQINQEKHLRMEVHLVLMRFHW